jgi:preprotein translocase subunit SecG
METLIQIVHVIVALFMIFVVLVQGGNQGGIGAAFGGGNSSGVFGATGATTVLGKMTYGAAIIFMITSVALTVMQGKKGDIGLKEKLMQSETTAPVETTTTAPAAAAATTSAPETAPVATPESGSAAPQAPAEPAAETGK